VKGSAQNLASKPDYLSFASLPASHLRQLRLPLGSCHSATFPNALFGHSVANHPINQTDQVDIGQSYADQPDLKLESALPLGGEVHGLFSVISKATASDTHSHRFQLSVCKHEHIVKDV
jgi:hypothetical protein